MLEREGFVYKESGLGTKALSKKVLEGSIYSYLHKELHIKFGGDFRRVKADLPDEYDQQYLGDSETTTILKIEQIVWTNSGVNLEYSRSRNVYSNRSYITVETSH